MSHWMGVLGILVIIALFASIFWLLWYLLQPTEYERWLNKAAEVEAEAERIRNRKLPPLDFERLREELDKALAKLQG